MRFRRQRSRLASGVNRQPVALGYASTPSGRLPMLVLPAGADKGDFDRAERWVRALRSADAHYLTREWRPAGEQR